jgi:hypothetical protein
MRDSSAISLSEVTAKQSADNRRSGANDQKDDAGGKPAGEVREEKDENSCVHQYRQHDSYEFLRHVLPPCAQSVRLRLLHGWTAQLPLFAPIFWPDDPVAAQSGLTVRNIVHPLKDIDHIGVHFFHQIH